MPARILVDIEPKVLHPAGPWSDTGPAVHGYLLSVLRRSAPELAERLHQPARGGQPFALTPILQRSGPGPQWRFEVGVLDDALTDTFVGALSTEPVLRVGHSSFITAGVRAVVVPYEELLARSRPVSEWTLRLVTPLTFRTTGTSGARRSIPIPDPQLLFGRLRLRFSRYAPPGLLAGECDVAIAEHLAIASLNLVSDRHLVKAPRQREIGCTGTVGYVAVHADALGDDALRGVDALVNFSAFAGAGDQTSKGMGVTVPVAR